jgi:cell division protein FtsL
MYTQKKPIDNAHIVRERDRQRFRELLAVLALGIPIGLFLLLFTWQNLEVIRLGREATNLQKVRKEIDEENKRLQVEIDRLTALESVQKRATELGLKKTEPAEIVMVSGGQAILPVTRTRQDGQAGLPVLQERR